MSRIAEEARKVAQTEYGPSVNVSVEQMEGGLRIVANGEAVVFLEFGAGTQTNGANMFTREVPFPVKDGSYSESVKGEYYRTGKWHFGGVEYTYIVPRNAMQKAYESVARNCERIAREVFG